MRIEYQFDLPLEDARARIAALGEYMTNRHGIVVAWDGDRATFRGKYLMVPIDGVLSLAAGKAVFDGRDPGFLWRAKARGYIEGKLQAYLDKNRRIEELLRG